jgi:hypothetical protein
LLCGTSVHRVNVALNGSRPRRPLTDAAIERFIRRAGADRVLAVANQMTAPTAVASELRP